MNAASSNAPSSAQVSFKDFLSGDAARRRFMLIIPVALIAQFILFKLFYPFPDFFGDSYSYIQAAQENLSVNIWPIGYSKFLQWFPWFTHSDLALVLFQYLLLEVVALYFYNTLIYFYPTRKPTRIILCIFLFFNPLNLYVCNYVSSDGMFWALSLLWLTELLWILNRPNIFHLITLSITFFIAFTFRYNAMFYPVIAAIVFIISRQPLWIRIAGICAGPALIIPFIIWSSNAAKDISGTAQFPPILGGWQWANNALYIREYIKEDTTGFPSSDMAELDRISRKYFRIVPPQYRYLPPYVGNFFIQQPMAPLKQYMFRHYPDGGIADWAKAAPLFKQYGLYIIKRHPLAFVRHFMWMNAGNYITPPLEKLEIYNLGSRHVDTRVAQWFHYPSTRIRIFSNRFQGYFLGFYPYLFLILNVFFAWSIFAFIRQKGFRRSDPIFKMTAAVVTLLILANMGFSISANIIAFRYQLFPMVCLLAFYLLVTDYTERYLQEKKAGDNTAKKDGGPQTAKRLAPQL